MADSIFPFIDATVADDTQATDLSTPREYGFDFEQKEFILKDGKDVIVEGLEAIKTWIYKALLTKRYAYPVYSWDYGSEIEDLIGSGYSKAVVESEAKRYVEECLSINPYIKGIKDLITSFSGDDLSIEFTVITDYGEVSVSV